MTRVLAQGVMAMVIVLVTVVACGPPASPPGPVAASPPTRCDYEVTVAEPLSLAVDVRCDAPITALIASEAAMAHHVDVAVAGRPIPRRKARFDLPPDAREASYRLDLQKVAQEHGDIDVAFQASSGDAIAWVAAVSTWILRPFPIARETTARITLSLPEGMGFTTGMPQVDAAFQLRAREIRFATYGVFGQFTSERLSLPGPLSLGDEANEDAETEAKPAAETMVERPAAEATIELVTVPGRLATDVPTRTRWVRDTAVAISEFWHGFPVGHAMVLLIPTPGHNGVAHGKVVAAGGPGVAIHIGSLAKQDDLYGDWILVHELFHLGFPSFSGEGKWLDEGLATYFEPIIRARAGWRTPHAVWSEFATDMDQGLPAVESTGVENTTSFKGIYWGGAILSLLADVETRRRTGGKVGLEDGLRAVLARGGNASELWTLNRAIAVIDQRLGSNTLHELAAAHRFAGRPIGLPQLWRDLGIQLGDSGFTFDETATLSPIRQAIIAPP